MKKHNYKLKHMKENEESLFWFLERNKNIEIVSMFWINKDECKIVYDEVKQEIEKECKPFYMGFDKTELDKIHKFIMENGVKVIDITQESKYTPTHDELLEMGFNPFKLLKNPPTPYWERIKNLYNYTYFPISNLLFRDKVEIPFHTKEDFMKVVGYEKQEWKPSEELLRELGFNSNGKKYLGDNCISYFKGKFHCLNIYYGKVIELFLHSDSELRMLVEILRREK